MAALITFIAFIADWIIGDPQKWPHPVRFIGQLISACEEKARQSVGSSPGGLRRAGIVMAFLVVLATMSTAWLLLFAGSAIGSLIWFLVSVYLVYSALCLRELYRQTWQVEKALAAGYIDEARQRLSWVVGRDTAKLDENGIRRAVIETLAENLSDGLIAPLFYLALGGPVLAWGYKAVNTLDSMVGYKNERFLNLGRFSARLDDAVNYIPARLAAVLLVASARFQGYDWQKSLAVWKRDGRLHSSPNAGHPEAAMAGALNIWLGGPGYYGGTLCEKPIIHPEGSEAGADSFRSAERLMVGAAILMVFLTIIFLFCFTGYKGWLL